MSAQPVALPILLLFAMATSALPQPLSEPPLRAPAEVMGDRPTSRPSDGHPPSREPNPTRLQPQPPNSAARTDAALENGRSNLTEAQARARFEQAGYGEIGELRLELGGIWRATGRLDGQARRLGMDHRGTIRAE